MDGIYSRSLANTTSLPILSLSPPRPSPFAESTTIEFNLETSGPAEVDIHDVGGRLIRRVTSGQHPAGAHTATWDGYDASGQRVAPGTYFSTLTTGAARITRKMTFLPR